MGTFRWWAILTLAALIACGERAIPSAALKEGRDNAEVPPPASAPAPTAGFGDAGNTLGTAADEVAPRPEIPRHQGDPAAIPSMIIRTGQASLQIDSLELAVDRLRQLAARLGGYVANSQVQAGENQLRSATLELKVPAPRFDELTTGLSPIGKVEYVNVSAEDVGEEFTDITARVSNAHRLEQRLIDLLATRTGKLSDVLEIERELARVREEIERMEGRLRFLRSRTATSTLSVTVHERAPLVGEPGSGGVVSRAFQQAWRNFVNFVATLIQSLGIAIPLGALVIGGLLGLRSLWRAHRRSSS
jgi:hypothetical protein